MSMQLLTVLGGLGLFLLGMTVMTDGLRGMAGETLQRWLSRFTGSPYTGAMTGTVSTAMLQSSSATTVTTVGLVAAGLLSFPQALGIVYGANVGTTITGWMVALLGFKLQIGAAALPVIFLGMMLRMFGRGRWAQAGRTLAGFGLVFLGIDYLQAGMAGMESTLTPDSFPPDTLGGRLLLVALGAALTLVTQSSSAGVAIAMTALSAGTISFPQAACLVIGMDVGTTVTAVLASLGSSVEARRTGFSHTIYNIFTAIAALLILDIYIRGVDSFWPAAVQASPELVLVGFHTVFNVLALVIGLPLARPFALLMERLVPDSDDRLARHLDDGLLREPAAAEAAMLVTLRDEFAVLLGWMSEALSGMESPSGTAHEAMRRDLEDTREYLDRMNELPSPDGRQRKVATGIHTLDHLSRMQARLRQSDHIRILVQSTDLQEARDEVLAVIRGLLGGLTQGISEQDYDRADRLCRRLRESSAADRERVITQAVERDISAADTGAWMAGRRWLERMAHHVWRISAHLGGYEIVEEEPD
jgi:phosphate:Na+ symporter